jgi:hypothetical protein
MAKVSLSIKSLNSTDFNEDKVQKLESNDIPFEINDEKIHLISKGTVYVQSRTYNKPYSKFCMQIADSAKEASISMGEGGLDGEKLAILFQVFGWDLEFEIELSCGGEYESGTLITDEDPDTYEMIWVFSVEDSSSQEEDEDLQENLFQEFEGWDTDNSSARLVIVSLKKNIKNLDEEELLDYYGLTDGDDGEIQSYMYSDSIEGLTSSQELGSDVFKNEITSAKDFFDKFLKFNFDHLWFIDNDGLKFISEIGDEDISLVEKNYSMFEYAIVCEVCHLTGEDY